MLTPMRERQNEDIFATHHLLNVIKAGQPLAVRPAERIGLVVSGIQCAGPALDPSAVVP